MQFFFYKQIIYILFKIFSLNGPQVVQGKFSSFGELKCWNAWELSYEQLEMNVISNKHIKFLGGFL